MKKNLTIIAMLATALICSCGSSESNNDAAEAANTQTEKAKVKIANVTTEEEIGRAHV